MDTKLSLIGQIFWTLVMREHEGAELIPYHYNLKG